jgi:hypothetical protein
MGLEYSICDSSSDKYHEVNIPIANYYKVEGQFLNATINGHWQGFNNESFYWIKKDDKIILENEEENILETMSLDEFKSFLDDLSDSFLSFHDSIEIINILRLLLESSKQIEIYFD